MQPILQPSAVSILQWMIMKIGLPMVSIFQQSLSLKRMLYPPGEWRDVCDQVIEIMFALVHTKVGLHGSQRYKASKFIAVL